MTEHAAGAVEESHVSEHLEAVVSGRLRQAFLLTLKGLTVARRSIESANFLSR